MTETPLRYGLYLPPFGPLGEPAVLVDLAVRAEAAGWDGVFLWDHVVTDALPIADTWTTLAAIAQATERILLGPMITPLPRRRPWVVARHASTVSRLSGGRLVLGVGLGSDESGDFSRFGEPTDPAVRSAMLDEALTVLRAIWSGQAVRHAGTHYRVDIEAGAPEPYPIPIWVASSTGHPRVARRAAGCDGIFPNPDDHMLSPAEVAAAVEAVRRNGLPADRPFAVAVRGNVSEAWGDEPNGIDLAALARAGMTWWMESLIHFDPLELTLKVVDAGPPRP
jgi:alkanesulfonate monooxygenase SsuD/methylene tetrahydromethanopterin reductase-like flavin-dependent oxidoreductase (luciferase family)